MDEPPQEVSVASTSQMPKTLDCGDQRPLPIERSLIHMLEDRERAEVSEIDQLARAELPRRELLQGPAHSGSSLN